MTEFDVYGELPRGVAVLEASAGTGKTFTIAALAARYVADGVPLDKLLVVTFTRMATGELRERVRDRLVSVERALETRTAHDRLTALLLQQGVEQRLFSTAVAGFDAATIVTTHGFCKETLGSLGFVGDIERECTFVETVEDLIDEVIDDLYVRRFSWDAPVFSRTEAAKIVRAAIRNPGARLVPDDAEPNHKTAMRHRLAIAARDELERRKRRNGVMTYDDVLVRLDDALKAPGGEVVAQRLRDRYSVVLIDEFQDTDPVQWSIMRRAFGESTLILIGDPKQAIYAFRGADVHAYLDAKATAATDATLDVNWRSDQGLIDAYDELFGGAKLGHEGIVYTRVRAALEHQQPRISGVSAPVRVRIVDRNVVGLTQTGWAITGPARDFIARDVADDIVALLDSDAQIEGAPVRPGDIAVLVRRNRDAAAIRETLAQAGVPAVINGAGSVFASDSARHWLRLLEALERPASTLRARAAALTSFFGWDAERVAGADDDAWEDVHQRLHHWAQVLRGNGIASLTEVVTRSEGLPGRVLPTEGGEREMTDLRHLAQLLHAEANREHLGIAALVTWLRRRIAESEQEADEERSRRLESDAAAVQVLTIHRSKGLEFPIVYYPSLWEPSWIPGTDRDPEPVLFHDGDQRTLDVGLEGHAYLQHKARHEVELRGEDLRLAYVALTRARHQAVIWWAGTRDSENSPLSRLLFDRADDGTVPAKGNGVPTDEQAAIKLREVAARVPGRISVEQATLVMPRSWDDELPAPAELAAASFDRRLDWHWRRTSYTDLTAAGHEARVTSEPEERLIDDEPEVEDVPLLAEMPAGPQVGTLIHDLFERADFAAPDLAGELAARLAESRRRVDLGDETVALAGLGAAIETPFADGVRLRDLTRGDRLDELVFELPLAGGETPAGVVTPGAIAAALRAHLDPGDPLRAYAERLSDPDLRGRVRGYLTGSIDLVFRVDGRYGIVDYKSNRLTSYGPAALSAEMYRAHYALQGLLYTVALHRYLRWRDPSAEVGGIYYLFLRGMTGPPGAGVFAWHPPRALVVALSDLLDRGAA